MAAAKLIPAMSRNILCIASMNRSTLSEFSSTNGNRPLVRENGTEFCTSGTCHDVRCSKHPLPSSNAPWVLKKAFSTLCIRTTANSPNVNALQEKTPYFINAANAPRFMQMAGLETKIITGLRGEKMMMALNTTFPGHTVPLHSHPHEQIGIVYPGRAKLRIGEEERIVGKGDFYCIPANVPHTDTCLGDEPFVMLDIFYPIREDFLRKLKESER